MKKHPTSPRQAPAEPAATPAPGPADRQASIAVAAYYHAERRGFAPGGELDDWLRAEADCHATARGD